MVGWVRAVRTTRQRNNEMHAFAKYSNYRGGLLQKFLDDVHVILGDRLNLRDAALGQHGASDSHFTSNLADAAAFADAHLRGSKLDAIAIG